MAALRFANSRTVNASNLAELPEPFRLQMARAATLGFGASFTTALEFVEQCGGAAQLWDVVEATTPEQPLFQVWMYDGDLATVFLDGTQQDAGVSMSQSRFEKHGVPGTDSLAQALQAAFDSRDND